MWTEEHRAIYRRDGKGFPSDLRDAQWVRLVRGRRRLYSGTREDKQTEETCDDPARADVDFSTIRYRVMMQLRREREQIEPDQKGRSPVGPRPYYRGATGDAKRYAEAGDAGKSLTQAGRRDRAP